MSLETLRFGEIETDNLKVLHFSDGLPGLEDQKSFYLLDFEEYSPFLWLQSIDMSGIALPLIDPFSMIPNFSVDVNDEEMKQYQLDDKDNLLVLCVVVIPEELEKMTVNLVAPVFINMEKGIGRQVFIDNTKYSVREPLFPLLEQHKPEGE